MMSVRRIPTRVLSVDLSPTLRLLIGPNDGCLEVHNVDGCQQLNHLTRQQAQALWPEASAR